jgi:uncharacterized protein
MIKYSFEWNNKKLNTNIVKHKIHFEEAGTVLADPNALTVYDSEHSDTEDRWYTIGFSNIGKLLIVNHTYRKTENKVIIRIYSARKAKKLEQKQYKDRI